MKKIITILVSAFISTNIFAACNFPHHFHISGPAGIQITKLEPSISPNIKIEKTSENSFDVVLIDERKCDLAAFKLRVSLNNDTYSEIIAADGSGKIGLVSVEDSNLFFDGIDDKNNPYFEIHYI